MNKLAPVSNIDHYRHNVRLFRTDGVVIGRLYPTVVALWNQFPNSRLAVKIDRSDSGVAIQIVNN